MAAKQNHRRHSTLLHLIAGGTGGTVGALITCPLEVLQTRLQSSGFRIVKPSLGLNVTGGGVIIGNASGSANAVSTFDGIWACFRHMIKHEGVQSLFRGLGPNLVGVLPSRSLYFAVYSKSKDLFNSSGWIREESTVVHMVSSAAAGFTTSTVTNPLWFIKTRLQLDTAGKRNLNSILFMVREVYRREGLPAFYRGLTASYVGISETVINFVIYEHLKMKIKTYRGNSTSFNPLHYIYASIISKSIASVIAYPHEVARTRLRQQITQDGKRKYRSLIQTLRTVTKEEGVSGLYGGMGTHVLRQIPNTCIMFCVYEAVVHFFSRTN